MARAGSDDRLDRAMEVFWANGYYDTSIDELISRTGLHRAAVYERFGSKRGLFEATLRRYRERVVAKLVAPLAGPDAARADIDRFGSSERSTGPQPRRRPRRSATTWTACSGSSTAFDPKRGDGSEPGAPDREIAVTHEGGQG